MAHTLRKTDCVPSGYTRFGIYPTPNQYKGKKHKGTTSPEQLAAISKNNGKIARRNFLFYVLENFTPKDYCVTMTFPTHMSDDIRCKEMENCIERLRYLYSKHDAKLKYICVWGRGELNNMLHCHILVNRHQEIKYNDLWAAANKYDLKKKEAAHNYHVQKIKNKYGRGSRLDTMKATAYYLIQHWDTMLPDDEKLIKRRWYKSNSVTKPLDEKLSDKFDEADALPVSPTMMMRKLLHAKEYGSLEDTVAKLFPEYKQISSCQIHLYQDFIGRWHFEVELIRKDSPLDESSRK